MVADVYHVCLENNVLVTFFEPSQEYPHIVLKQVGPALAHAGAPGSAIALCRTEQPLISLRMPWSDEIPAHWVRCSECLSANEIRPRFGKVIC